MSFVIPCRFKLVLMAFVMLGATSAFAQEIPTPEKVLGFRVGADYHLATYEQAIDYWRALEKASPLIRLFEFGKTSEGRPQMGAIITSAENMQKLDRYQEITRRLSLVTGVDDKEARSLAAEGRAVVYIDGGLHATECAPAQELMQLAYDLVSGTDPKTRLIRDNVITLLVFPNPDGMTSISNWYTNNVGTPYEVSPMPWLYNKYVGHDNNRDLAIFNQIESQNLARLQGHEWYPEVWYNKHQTGPFPARIFVPPYAEPLNPNYHPLLVRGKNLIGTAMGFAFEEENKSGVISRTSYDQWYPGYLDQFTDFFNIVSILTECQLYRYATPHFYTVDDFPEQFRDFTPSAFYPNPWKGGWWRLRDAVEYCLTASKAVLHTAAVYREDMLYNKYRMGKDIATRYEKEAPYAYIIPQQQWDPPTAALLLNRMILAGIQVNQADKPFTVDRNTWPAGTWIIPMAQPFASFVKSIFEEQNYSNLAANGRLWQGVTRPIDVPGGFLPPYDMAGWTFPYQMGVKVVTAYTPVNASSKPVDEARPIAGSVKTGASFAYLISPKANNSFIAVNRILKKGGEVLRALDSFTVAGETYPPGTYIVPAKSVPASLVESVAKDLYLTVGATPSALSVGTVNIRAPRIALYKSWTASMDEGWTRWLFEQFEFPFTNISDADVKAGSLVGNFDVLVIPSMSASTVVEGLKPGTAPPQYTGGLGETGVRNIKQFVQSGGTIVILNNAAEFAIDKLGVAVTDDLKGVKPEDFLCLGSVLRMRFNVKHPVAYGMPEEAPAMFISSPAFSIGSGFGKMPETIAQYPESGILMSGFLRGDQRLRNKASALDVQMGAGKAILLGFGVQQRAQPYGTFKLLFNALYYGSSSPAAVNGPTAVATPTAR
jgi:hypothetical protein